MAQERFGTDPSKATFIMAVVSCDEPSKEPLLRLERVGEELDLLMKAE